MRLRRLLSLVALAALLVGGCTIEQDLTPRIDAAGATGDQDDPSEGPSAGPSSDPTDGPSTDASEEPTDEPSEDPSEEPSPEVTVPGNTPPVATADTATTSEDTAVVIDVLSNDNDPDGDPLTPSVPASPGRGTATVTGGAIRYVPDPNVTGTDRFTYTVKDGRGGTATATVSVTIAPVNDAPVAVNDQLTTPEDTTVTIDVLANDEDVDGDALSIASVGTPSQGTARITGGKVVYDPASNATGKDSFTYVVRDPSGATDGATVTVEIGGRNDAPVARDDSASTSEDRAVTIDVLGNDSDPDGDAVSIASVGTPGKGAATASGGEITYTPDTDVNGTDAFTYTVRDPSGATDTATVSVSISPANDPPVASGDSMSVAEDSGATSKNVVANDRDPDGDSLVVSGATQPSLGKVTFSGANVTFTPNANANGSTSFTYTVSDGNGTTDTATVSVTITPVNDAPTASGDGPYLVNLGQAVTITDLLANDRDVDGDGLSIELVSGPSVGSVSLVDGTTVEYTNKTYAPSESFTYRASDGTARSQTVTVTIEINRPPVARNESFRLVTGFGERLVDYNVLTGTVNSGCCGTNEGFTGGRDTDPDGDALTYVSPTALRRPLWMTGFQCESGGRCQIRFAECQERTYSYTYTIRDEHGLTASATVSFTLDEQCIR